MIWLFLLGFMFGFIAARAWEELRRNGHLPSWDQVKGWPVRFFGWLEYKLPELAPKRIGGDDDV